MWYVRIYIACERTGCYAVRLSFFISEQSTSVRNSLDGLPPTVGSGHFIIPQPAREKPASATVGESRGDTHRLGVGVVPKRTVESSPPFVANEVSRVLTLVSVNCDDIPTHNAALRSGILSWTGFVNRHAEDIQNSETAMWALHNYADR